MRLAYPLLVKGDDAMFKKMYFFHKAKKVKKELKENGATKKAIDGYLELKKMQKKIVEGGKK